MGCTSVVLSNLAPHCGQRCKAEGVGAGGVDDPFSGTDGGGEGVSLVDVETDRRPAVEKTSPQVVM